jgi:hypothetical protein
MEFLHISFKCSGYSDIRHALSPHEREDTPLLDLPSTTLAWCCPDIVSILPIKDDLLKTPSVYSIPYYRHGKVCIGKTSHFIETRKSTMAMHSVNLSQTPASWPRNSDIQNVL